MNGSKTPALAGSKRRLFKGVIITLLVVIVGLIPIFVESPYYLHILILTLIYFIASVSFRTIMLSGQFPLAHAAFMGLGAYAAGITSRWLGWQPWLTIPFGALLAAGIGILIGYPFARLRALYYAMVSLFFGIGVLQIIYAFGRWTGSYGGLAPIEPMFTGPNAKIWYFYFFLALTLFSLIALYRFESSRIGVTMKAIAQSHLVADSVGINEAKYRILAVGVGCFFVGLAGSTYAHYNLVASPSSFNLNATLWFAMYVLVGGVRSFAGPIVGTAVLILLPEFVREMQMFTPFVSAAILLIMVYFIPGGLVSLPSMFITLLRKRKKSEGIAHVTGS